MNKLITDFDISIDCFDTNHQTLVDALTANRFTDFIFGGSFINCNKKLKNGLKLDISLKITPVAWHDPIPNARGKAEIIFDDSKHSPFIKIIKTDPFYKSFKNAGKYKEMELDPPSMFTRNYAFRLYKAVKGYRGIIKIKNIKEIRNELYKYYLKTLEYKKITIYFELSDFVKHQALDAKDNDAIKMLKLIFNVFFKPKLDLSVKADEYVKGFVDFFITCKDYLFYEDKKVFIEQIDLMTSLYLDKCKLDEIKDQVINVKFLHLQSIQKKKFAQEQAAVRAAQASPQYPAAVIPPPIISPESSDFENPPTDQAQGRGGNRSRGTGRSNRFGGRSGNISQDNIYSGNLHTHFQPPANPATGSPNSVQQNLPPVPNNTSNTNANDTPTLDYGSVRIEKKT